MVKNRLVNIFVSLLPESERVEVVVNRFILSLEGQPFASLPSLQTSCSESRGVVLAFTCYRQEIAW